MPVAGLAVLIAAYPASHWQTSQVAIISLYFTRTNRIRRLLPVCVVTVGGPLVTGIKAGHDL